MLGDNNFFGGGGEAGFYEHPIEQSLRFNDDDSAYLSRTFGTATSTTTGTWSCWVKRGNIGSDMNLYSASNYEFLQFYGDKIRFSNPSGSFYWITSQVFRDTSAWYHIVIAFDTTLGTASDRAKLWVNGTQVTAWDANPTITQNSTFARWNVSGQTGVIGQNGSSSRYYDGYIAECHWIDGEALDASSFGENKSGVWIPKAYSGSYGTNGFYLDFADGAAIGDDESGNTNDWTANNLAATDVVLDSPTNNFATLNPISRNGANALATFSEGNLKVYKSTGDYYQAMSTIPITSGKWYAELRVVATQAKVQFGVLVDDKSSNTVTNRAIGQDGYSYYYTGQTLAFGTATSYGATFTAGDILGIAVDADSGSITFYKNGSSQGTAFSSLSYDNYLIGCSLEDGGSAMANFGQDSSFAGAVTAQGNTDDNGYGDFYYAPPSGYLALCTANLTIPEAIDPALDASPQDYFNTVLWTGDGSTSTRSLSGVGFQPDFVWRKLRAGSTVTHMLQDVIRGTTETSDLSTDRTDAEGTLGQYGYISSYDADGFSVSAGSSGSPINTTNASGWTYVAWNWKANGSGVSNTDGSITSTVSANTDAGFSIVSYTGNGSTSPYPTVGHGLSEAPEIYLVKDRSATGNWVFWHTIADGSLDYMYLNSTAANANSGIPSAPTSSVVQVGGPDANDNGNNYIAYCFHSVEGFSKFGKYSGNGNNDGPFVYTGFRPAFVITKVTNTADNWTMADSVRSTSNVIDDYLLPNQNYAEVTNSVGDIDFLSNGFKLRNSDSTRNRNGDTHIYMAFAENPFKYSNAR